MVLSVGNIPLELNIEYLWSRPGILKIFSILLGSLAVGLGCHGHFNSFYTTIVSDNIGKPIANIIPGIELEVNFLVSSIVFLTTSIVFLVSYCIVFHMSESKTCRLVDTVFHLVGALLIFVSGVGMLYSTLQIEDAGCHLYGMPPQISHLEFRKYNFNLEHVNCQLLEEKITAGVIQITNGILYAVIAFVVRSAKII